MNCDIEEALNAKLRDELNLIARKLRIAGYRSLNRRRLVSAILECDEVRVRKCLSISWWDRYHNHVYGGITVAAFLLSIVFFVVPILKSDRQPQPRVVLGLSSPDYVKSEVINVLSVRNEGQRTASGIQIELKTLPSDTFNVGTWDRVASIERESISDEAGGKRPFVQTVVKIRRLVPGERVLFTFRSNRSEWDGMVPKLRTILPDIRYPILASATDDDGWIDVEYMTKSGYAFESE